MEDPTFCASHIGDNMSGGEQCILGKLEDNGTNHAQNFRTEVDKTQTENKNIYVIINQVVCIIIFENP